MGKRLIVGLGNPGAAYEGTRHNVGFRVVEALAERCGVEPAEEGRALVGWGRRRGRRFGLARPRTYMNRSGEAVKRLMDAHDLPTADLLVVLDDLHLDAGAIRLRAGGSAGGHNGMAHIIDRLGTTAVPRLRLGIGSDFARGQQVDYVLSPFSSAQEPLVEDAVIHACNAALVFVTDGIEEAMNRFN